MVLRWTEQSAHNTLPFNLDQLAIPLPHPLKIFNHILTHLNPHLVCKMEFILIILASTPLVPPVSLKLYLGPINHPLGGPGAPDVEPRHLGDVVLSVEALDPLIDLVDFSLSVNIARRCWTIVREPDKLWSRQERGNSKGVGLCWVIVYLVVNIYLEPLDLLGDGLKGPTLDEVI